MVYPVGFSQEISQTLRSEFQTHRLKSPETRREGTEIAKLNLYTAPKTCFRSDLLRGKLKYLNKLLYFV